MSEKDTRAPVFRKQWNWSASQIKYKCDRYRGQLSFSSVILLFIKKMCQTLTDKLYVLNTLDLVYIIVWCKENFLALSHKNVRLHRCNETSKFVCRNNENFLEMEREYSTGKDGYQFNKSVL